MSDTELKRSVGGRRRPLLGIGVGLCIIAAIAIAVWHGSRVAADKTPATASGESDAAAATSQEAPGQVTLTSASIRRYGIRIGSVRKQKLAATFVAPGRVMLNGDTTAVVGSAVAGRVAQIKVSVGSEVKKNDELLVIESVELADAQSDYLQKQAALSAAKSVVVVTAGAAERAKSLFDKSQGISLTEMQKRESDHSAARSNLLVAEAADDAAINKLRTLGFDDAAAESLRQTRKVSTQYVIRAPIPGTVVERTANLGERITPERESLLVIADTSTLWVSADVPESRIHEIAIGSKASVIVSASNEPVASGVVSQIGVSVDPATRSVPVRIALKGVPGLKPGVFAHVEIASRGAADSDSAVLGIPEAAVQTIDGKTSVFVPKKDDANTFAVRNVEVGEAVGGMLPVHAGLEENERVVTAGSFILKADLGKASAKDED